VVVKCKYIQNTIVLEKDPQLYHHLTRLKVEPHLYMLRWIRLLFGREFHLQDLFIMWDALFAHSKELNLVDYICTAMLIYIRYQLLDKDYTACLKRLFKYPPVEDVHLFVEKAISMQRGEPQVEFHQTPNTRPARTHQHHPHARASLQLHPGKFFDPLTNTMKHILSGEDQNVIVHLHAEVESLKHLQAHMANRLERIVYSMQREIIERPEAASFINDSLAIAIAELKQVKDILNGSLPLDTDSAIIPQKPVNAISLALNASKVVPSNDKHQSETQEKLDEDPLGVGFVHL